MPAMVEPVDGAERALPARVIRTAVIETLHGAADDPRAGRRLAVVQATVAFVLRDAEPFAVRFGDGDVVVLDGEDHGEVRLELDARDLHELFDGGPHLALKIVDGQVDYAGQVRRFLRVTGILSSLRDAYREHLSHELGGAVR